MANSQVIGLLRILLSASSAEWETTMKRSADSAKAWSRELKQVGRQATDVGMALTKTLTLPTAGIGIAAAKMAIEFEASFAGVRKTVDATEPQLAELAQGFRNLSKTIPVNVNDLNRLGEAAGALGIPRDKILDFASVMARLGVSTNLTADQASDAIARIQNIFGAAGQDTERLASTLVALGNAGASTEKEIVEMGQRIAGAGHTVGLTRAQVLAFASTLASVGINAEAGGSAISRVFLKINDGIQKGGPALAEFARVAGVSGAQFKKAFQTDAAGATQMFIEGLGRLKSQGENINQTIEGLTGKNIILKDTLFRLSGAGGLLNDQLKIADGAWKSNTALTKEAAERFKTTESRLILLGNRVKDVGISLGNALGPAIDMAIRGLTAFIPVLEQIVGVFNALPASVQLGIVGIAGLVAAAGPAIYVFGQLALATSALTGAFMAKGLASRVLLADLGFLGTAMRANVVSAMATVTSYGAMGAASIALTGATRALGAAIMAMPWAAATAGAAALAAGLVYLYGRSKDLELQTQTQGAKQDAINRALKNGAAANAEYAAATDKYAAAVKFNTEWEEKRLAAFNRANRGANSLAEAQAQLTAANEKYKKELTGIAGALAFQIQHMAETGKTTADLAKEFGISEQTVVRYGQSLRGATGETKELTKEQKKAASAAAKHAEEIKNLGHALDGTSILTGLAQTNEAIKAMGLDLRTLPLKALQDINEQVTAAIGIYRGRGEAVPKAIMAEWLALQGALTKAKELNAELDRASRPQMIGPGMVGMSTKTIGALGGGPQMIPPSIIPTMGAAGVTGAATAVGETLAAAMGKALQQLPNMLVAAFTGGGNVKGAVQGMGTLLGSTLGEHIGKGIKMLGKYGGPIGEAIGSLAGPLIGLIANMFGTAGRDAVKDFAATFKGGFDGKDGLHEALNTLGAEGERLWIKLTQGTGRNNPEQAKATIDEITAALARQKEKTEEVAAAAAASAAAQQESLDAITAKYAESIDKLDTELTSLKDSVSKEAEEEFMGIVEADERRRIAQLESEKAVLEEQRDAEIEAKKATFDAVLDAGKQHHDDLQDYYNEHPLDMPWRFRQEGTAPSAGSSYVPASALDRGFSSGAMTSWERTAPRGAAAGQRDVTMRTSIYLDSFGLQKLTEAVSKGVLV